MAGIYCIINLENNPDVIIRENLHVGEIRICPILPKDTLQAVRAQLTIRMADNERVFFNGFQTWTYCPEYTASERIRGLSHLPNVLVKHYGLNRYGDNYFVEYTEKPGIFHGESWCYFRDGDRYRLLASLDERAGYTVFRYNASSGLMTIQRDCKGLSCNGAFPAFELFYAEGTEQEVFDAWFDAMGIKPRTTEKIAGYSSWYNRYQKISAKTIGQDLEGCDGFLAKNDLFQVDDGWEPAVGDWLECDRKKFPDGMKSVADEIHAKGFRAGIWLAPFICQKGSDIYKNHKDWLYLHNGEPWYCGSNWGGFYALDIDHPEVVKYIEKTFDRVLNEWGFDLVKLDFLYGAAPFGNARETRAGRMYRAMELLRRVCGEKLILGCGVPVMPAFGIVDYCRISCDVGLDWNDIPLMQQIHRERVSTKQAIGNTIFRRQLNGRAYLSDPDVFFLRDRNIRLSKMEKHVLATVNSLLGGVLLMSDNPAKYSPEAKEAYQQLLRNREAVITDIQADNGIHIEYELDGVRNELDIPI